MPPSLNMALVYYYVIWCLEVACMTCF